MSIKACKGLKLIHQNFPYVTIADDIATQPEEKGDLEITSPSKVVEGSHPGSDMSSSVVTSIQKEPPSTEFHKLPDRPSTIPYEATEENIINLENWLLETFSDTIFNTKQNPLPLMSGIPQHIHLADNAVPYAIHSPIPIPHHWREDVRNILQLDVDRHILEKVPVGEPVEWCTRMVTVKKKDGSPRITVD